MKRVYYPDHDERYAHIPPRERKDYPDELMIKMGKKWVTVIKRERNFADLTEEEWNGYGADLIFLAAKDIPMSRATAYH